MSLDPFLAIEKITGLNRRAARIAAGGFLVLVLTLSAWQVVKDQSVTFWHMLGAMIGLMIVMLVLSAFPAPLGRLIAWVLGLCFLAWAVAATSQVIAGNKLGIAPYECITSWGFSQTCGLSRAAAAAGVSVETTVTAERSDLAPDALPPPSDLAATMVFIQFAGYDRDDIQALAAGLVAQGWGVQGADRGGERTGAADGVNEVRYFHADDRARAEALALAVSAGMPAKPSVAVKDLSQSDYQRNDPGHLEVWISGRST